MKKKFILGMCALMAVSSFAQKEQKEVVQVESQQMSVDDDSRVIKRKVAVGRFSNETQYAKGAFYDKDNDPMGKQALDILSAKLAATEKFILLERNDLSSLLSEVETGGQTMQSVGADYLIIGSITEYGRKNTGEQKVFSNTKTQTVEAAVSIRLVDVSTGLIIYSDEAKGSAETSTKSTMGLGGVAGFDATLSDKAISAAISQLVENIVNKCTDKPWRTFFLAYDEEAILIAGGASQGLNTGDTFIVKTKGKSVKNPQTGIMIELPGKQVGKVEVLMTGGDTPETEYSFVSLIEGEVDATKLENYIIEEVK
jgi:curli biogenesis system outer membrane secretion channel CsgG